MRRDHVRLIRDLLIAINFPDKARAKLRSEHEHVRLAPILTSLGRSKEEDGEITPSAEDEAKGLRGSDASSDRNSTPTPPGRPTLPTLKQLLNGIPESRPMAGREMECDV